MYLELGGELFKLSREMGHSTVQVTEGYLKQFRSAEARREHTNFSPIGQLDLKKTKRPKKPTSQIASQKLRGSEKRKRENL